MGKNSVIGSSGPPMSDKYSTLEKDVKFTDMEKVTEELRQYSIREIDRLLVLLASGSIVFSIGFVKDIVPLNNAEYLFYLKLSWCSFSLSLITIILSHFSSRRLMDFFQKNSSKEFNKMKRWPYIITNVSFIAFLIGISSFIFFVMKNT